MAIKKCKECGGQVSTKANACPACGAKTQARIGTLSGLVIIFIAIWGFSRIFGGSDGSTARVVDNCDDITAFVMSQGFVKKALKAPSSADFPYITSEGVRVSKVGDCKFSVTAYVDAQNSFGAILRNQYSVTMESQDKGRSWVASGLSIK